RGCQMFWRCSRRISIISARDLLCPSAARLLFLSAVQVAIAFSLSPLLTLGVLGWGGLVAVVFRRRFGSQYDVSKRLVAGRRLTFAEISDFVHALKIAKSHSAESRHVDAFEAALETQSERSFAFEKRIANTRAAMQIVAAVTLGALVYVAANFVHVSPAAPVAMVAIFARLASMISQFQQFLANDYTHAASVRSRD